MRMAPQGVKKAQFTGGFLFSVGAALCGRPMFRIQGRPGGTLLHLFSD